MVGACGLKYGYARVSSEDQKAEMQHAAFLKAGVEPKNIFTDKLPGDVSKRPALLRCLKKLETGDTLIVWKLDRLSRSVRDFVIMADDLKERGVTLNSVSENIDPHNPLGRAMMQIAAIFAEMERNNIRERTRAGVAAAKARGVKFGRKPALTPEQIEHAKELRSRKKDPKTPNQIARILKCSLATVYRALAAA